MTLVSQPTHPAFYDRDLRHLICNVCRSEFTCPPPTRHELMASFTGPEIAALIDAGCVIAAHEAFSTELERQLEGMHPLERRPRGYQHWIRGSFLITSVEEDRGQEVLTFDNDRLLRLHLQSLDPDLGLTSQCRRFRLVPSHSLAGVAPEDMKDAVGNLRAPCVLCFAADEANCGHDHVTAVNLTRCLDRPPRPGTVEAAVSRACARYRSAARVELSHFIGGPCEEGSLVCCIVLGGGGCGWTLKKDLQQAIELAHSYAVKRCEAQGDIGGGQTVSLKGLQACPELNGEIGIVLRFAEASGRWLVRLRNGDGKKLKPANLEGLEGKGGRVFCFWGDARWSRTQLLGEIARGDWGLCRANVGDLAAQPSERWQYTKGRLAVAPITDMSESYMREAQRQMNINRAQVQMHRAEDPEVEGEG